MPALQTNYTALLVPGRPGQIVDMRSRTVISKTCASASGMAFGVIALRGVTDEAVLNVGDGGAGAIVGVTIVDPAIRPQFSNAYGQYDTVAVMIRGFLWVTVGSNVTPGVAAYYTPAGVITATSTSNTAIPNGFFESTTLSGAVAKLRLGS